MRAEGETMRKLIGVLGIIALALGLTGARPASAWFVSGVQVPGDFMTGGGFFFQQSGNNFNCINLSSCAFGNISGTRANFGWHGGVKNGNWWGNGNYIDHQSALHVHSTSVTGYVCVPESTTSASATDGCGNDSVETGNQPAGTRDICGLASVNVNGNTYRYRVRMKDSTNHPGGDGFAIYLEDSSGNPKYMAWANPINGGSVQLHKHNPSNTPPPSSQPPQCPNDYWLNTFTTLNGSQP
jgi:hypothetical protein